MISKKNKIKVGTHNGLFHCDEVMACSILQVICDTMDIELEIVRTRDKNELEKCDICVDIGGGIYDHHYKGFNERRKDGKGSRYASDGLVFRNFGRKLIELVCRKANQKATKKRIDKLFNITDKEIIEPIDREDNGIEKMPHTFDFINFYNPAWHEEQTLKKFDEQFYKAFGLTKDMLKIYLQNKINEVEVKKEEKKEDVLDIENLKNMIRTRRPSIVEYSSSVLKQIELGETETTNFIDELNTDDQFVIDRIQADLKDFLATHDFTIYPSEIKSKIINQKICAIIDSFYGEKIMNKIIEKQGKREASILEIPFQTMPWKEAIIKHNAMVTTKSDNKTEDEINFVLFPYPNGGYALQCVPPSMEDEFSQRIKLPITTMEGITFIHSGGFFARGNKDALVKLAQMAIELHNEKKANSVYEGR